MGQEIQLFLVGIKQTMRSSSMGITILAGIKTSYDSFPSLLIVCPWWINKGGWVDRYRGSEKRKKRIQGDGERQEEE